VVADHRTVDDVVQQWLEGHQLGLASSTVAGYRDALKRHISVPRFDID